MEENKQENGGQSATDQALETPPVKETPEKKPGMKNLFTFSMPHVDLPVLMEGMIPITLGIGGNNDTITLKEDEPLNDWLNQVLISLLNDLVEYFEGIVNEMPIPVGTADIHKLIGAPAPNEQELAEIRTKDSAFNEESAAKLQERQACAKQRLEECQVALERLKAQPHEF